MPPDSRVLPAAWCYALPTCDCCHHMEIVLKILKPTECPALHDKAGGHWGKPGVFLVPGYRGSTNSSGFRWLPQRQTEVTAPDPGGFSQPHYLNFKQLIGDTTHYPSLQLDASLPASPQFCRSLHTVLSL